MGDPGPVHPAEIIQTLIQIALLPGGHVPVEVLPGGSLFVRDKGQILQDCLRRLHLLHAGTDVVVDGCFHMCHSLFVLPVILLPSQMVPFHLLYQAVQAFPLFWIPRLIQLLPQILLFSIKIILIGISLVDALRLRGDQFPEPLPVFRAVPFRIHAGNEGGITLVDACRMFLFHHPLSCKDALMDGYRPFFPVQDDLDIPLPVVTETSVQLQPEQFSPFIRHQVQVICAILCYYGIHDFIQEHAPGLSDLWMRQVVPHQPAEHGMEVIHPFFGHVPDPVQDLPEPL